MQRKTLKPFEKQLNMIKITLKLLLFLKLSHEIDIHVEKHYKCSLSSMNELYENFQFINLFLFELSSFIEQNINKNLEKL